MKSRFVPFNFILLLILALALAGCETTKQTPREKADAKKHKKERTAIAFYLEASTRANSGNSVPIYRKSPIYVAVRSEPFLHSANVEEARLVEFQDGFAIQVRFDTHGAFVLDNVTGGNKNRRIAVFVRLYPDSETRWLAAPMITQRNETGVVTFTPDATREEAERIVRGINNAVKEFKRRERF